MFTVLEIVLVIALLGSIVYLWPIKNADKKQVMQQRVLTLEHDIEELKQALSVLLLKTRAFERVLPLSPEDQALIKQLEEKITVARYLHSIFPDEDIR